MDQHPIATRPPLGQVQHWPAPAKINRFLHVLGRRDDGYHSLQTEFQFLEWGDELEISPSDEPTFSLHGGVTENPADDLILRAASALQALSGVKRGAQITVHKRIPPGTGLGGGSSDAATTLLVLNHLWQLNLDLDSLCSLGLRLGADVPVFIRGHAAWAEGVGELLEVSEPDEGWTVLALPAASISTAAVFSHPDLPRDSARICAAEREACARRNDCEALVRRLSPAVNTAYEWLAEYGTPRMSGTGSALFLKVFERAQATAIVAQAPPFLRLEVVRRCNKSPLHVALGHASWR